MSKCSSITKITFQIHTFITGAGSPSSVTSVPVLMPRSATSHPDGRTHILINLPIISSRGSLRILTLEGLSLLDGLHQHRQQTSCRRICRCRTLNKEEQMQE